MGNWLTAEQGKRVLGVFDRNTLRGIRDYAMVAVLLGCGLRRAEVAALGVQDLQQREEGACARAARIAGSARAFCSCRSFSAQSESIARKSASSTFAQRNRKT
jgi:site-specific recombinase XerD